MTVCQICGSADLESVLNMGDVPMCNDLRTDAPKYPLHLVQCGYCKLVQIDCQLPQSTVFPLSYPYRSAMAMDFVELGNAVLDIAGYGDLIVDIGCNDGTFLAGMPHKEFDLLGIDPTDAIKDVPDYIPTQQEYFTPSSVRHFLHHAKVITASNVFAHVPDVHMFLAGVYQGLTEDGVFISENHYLGDLVRKNQWDTIYHEHLRYYSVSALRHLFDMHGMQVYDVQPCASHGGSIRVFADKCMRPVSPAVFDYLDAELEMDLAKFSHRADQSMHAIRNMLHGKQVIGIGAPSRAGTLAFMCGLNDAMVYAVAELRGSPKIGRFMPGTDIPIVDEHMLYHDQPNYAVIFSWHIADRIMKSLRTKGYEGKFIIPLPEPRIVE